MNLQQVINEAISRSVFVGEVTGNFYVYINQSPLFMSQDECDDYCTEIRLIPGVVSDEGQGYGCYFEVDPENYTENSQKLLVKLIENTRNSSKDKRNR